MSSIPSLYDLVSESEIPQALDQWKVEWNKLNRERRERKGMQPMASPAISLAETAVHGTIASVRPWRPSESSITSSASRLSNAHPSSNTTPERTSTSHGLFSSATYSGTSHPPLTFSHQSSPISAKSSPARPSLAHGSRMHAAAVAANASKSSPVKRKLEDVLNEAAQAAVAAASNPSTADSSMSVQSPPRAGKVSVHNGISMVSLKPSSHTSPYARSRSPISPVEPLTKKPKLASFIAQARNHLQAPPSGMSTPSPPPTSAAKSSPSKSKKDPLFGRSPRRKSAKIVGANTPGLHNSQGIISFTVGVDTPEDREKKEWMVKEYESWKAKKDERRSTETKGPRRQYTTPGGYERDLSAERTPSVASSSHADQGFPSPASSLGGGSIHMVTPLGSPAMPSGLRDRDGDTEMMTPQHAGVQVSIPATAPPGTHTNAAGGMIHSSFLVPSHSTNLRPSAPTNSGSRGGPSVRRSLFEALSRVSTPQQQHPPQAQPRRSAASSLVNTPIRSNHPSPQRCVPPSPLSLTHTFGSPLQMVDKTTTGHAAAGLVHAGFVQRKILQSPSPSVPRPSAAVGAAVTSHKAARSLSSAFRPEISTSRAPPSKPAAGSSIRSFLTEPSASPIAAAPSVHASPIGGIAVPTSQAPTVNTHAETVRTEEEDDQLSDGDGELLIVE